MHGTLSRRIEEARAIERNIMQGTAKICSPKFGNVCKALWPVKTAEELAARVGCTVRTAAYEISGEHHPSAQAILVVLQEITPSWK